MLLLDLLATKLNRWPTGVTYISQGRETGNLYDHNGDLLKPKTNHPISDNAGKHAIVYRVEWLARRRELAKASEETATTPPLSPAQRMVKARAEEVQPLQEQAKNPRHHDITISGHGASMGATEKPFEPFDFSGPVRDYSLKSPNPMPEPMTPVQWLSTDGKWKDGVYVGTVYGRIAVGCDQTKVVGWVNSGEIRLKPSMPLLALLAQHWQTWPKEFGEEVCQASDGRIYPVGAHSGIAILHVPLATDQEEATVTHGQWSWHRSNHTTLRTTIGRSGWNEEGFPLSGTTCEYDVSPRIGGERELITTVIKYSCPSVVVFECIAAPEGLQKEYLGYVRAVLTDGNEGRFIPVRSPSEIADEKLAPKVDAMLALDSTSGHTTRREFCELLLNHGYLLPDTLSRTATIAKLHEAYTHGASDHRGGIEAIYDYGFRLVSPPENKAQQ